MITIGQETIEAIAKQLKGHLSDYMVKIDRAYGDAEDGILTISLSAKLMPDLRGVKVQTGIAFIESKVKDSGIIFIDENQKKLFED